MNEKANELCLTMKGIALMKLVDAGVIRREEDGNAGPDGLGRWIGSKSCVVALVHGASECVA